MKEGTKISSVTLAYMVSAVILVGMSLAWIKGLDLGGRGIGIATVRGWNIPWLPITALIAVGCYVAAYRNEEDAKWLWGALGFSVLSLIPIFGVGIDIFSGADSLALSKVPLVGFWVTVIGFIGVIVIVARSIMSKKKSVE